MERSERSMSKNNSEEAKDPKEIRRLNEWISAVGGNIELGAASLGAVETSKSGKKLTVILKKPKPPKKVDRKN